MTHQPHLVVRSEIFENLSVHLDDVEFLQNAFVVQSLVAPLVRFSNRGRFEPYAAKGWTSHDQRWTFEIHPGLVCEDGQKISAETFRKSLKQSFLRFSLEDLNQMPFGALKGIENWLRNKNGDSLGLEASGDHLIFNFARPVGPLLLEYLSMTPFAFHCDANFNADVWRTDCQFISSGPFRLKTFNRENSSCELELRRDWPLAAHSAKSLPQHPEIRRASSREIRRAASSTARLT